MAPSINLREIKLRRACVELETSLKTHPHITARTLLDRDPELAGRIEDAIELIYTEYVVLERLGRSPSVEDFVRRYPEYAGRIRRLLAIHRLLDESPFSRDPTEEEPTPTPSPSPTPIVAASETSSGQASQAGSALGASNPLPNHPLTASPPLASLPQPATNGDSFLEEEAPFDVIEEIGRGGMGVVYKARHRRLDKFVAVKMLLTANANPTRQWREFRREAMALARLDHPHIVRILHAGLELGSPYLMLEYVDGVSLDQKVGDPWPIREAVELVERLALAVQHAHSKGIIHRDLKPANVLLSKDGVPKITDFGLARIVETISPPGGSELDPSWMIPNSERTEAHSTHLLHDAAPASGSTAYRLARPQLAGTLCYMAPEQIEGDPRLIGPSVDLHALGVLLFELLIGQPPFRGRTLPETLRQIQTQDPPDPEILRPGLDHDLAAILRKALAKSPQDRYSTADALAMDLRRFLEGRPVEALVGRAALRADRIATRAAGHTRRREALAYAAALVGLTYGVIARINAPSDQSSPPSLPLATSTAPPPAPQTDHFDQPPTLRELWTQAALALDRQSPVDASWWIHQAKRRERNGSALSTNHGSHAELPDDPRNPGRSRPQPGRFVTGWIIRNAATAHLRPAASHRDWRAPDRLHSVPDQIASSDEADLLHLGFDPQRPSSLILRGGRQVWRLEEVTNLSPVWTALPTPTLSETQTTPPSPIERLQREPPCAGGVRTWFGEAELLKKRSPSSTIAVSSGLLIQPVREPLTGRLPSWWDETATSHSSPLASSSALLACDRAGRIQARLDRNGRLDIVALSDGTPISLVQYQLNPQARDLVDMPIHRPGLWVAPDGQRVALATPSRWVAIELEPTKQNEASRVSSGGDSTWPIVTERWLRNDFPPDSSGLPWVGDIGSDCVTLVWGRGEALRLVSLHPWADEWPAPRVPTGWQVWDCRFGPADLFLAALVRRVSDPNTLAVLIWRADHVSTEPPAPNGLAVLGVPPAASSAAPR